jgi:probable rRNA maturation factor
MNPTHQIEIKIESHVEDQDIDVPSVEKAARWVLNVHDLEGPSEVVIVISDDEALEALNRRFRGEPQPTDVLSFENDTRGPFAGGTAAYPEYLGDVVISIDRAREQSADAGGTLNQELQLLTVHGVLHLLGYDHETTADKAMMWQVQRAALQALDADISLPE